MMTAITIMSCQKIKNNPKYTAKEQASITSQEGIDSVLSTLEKTPYQQLDTTYLNYSHPHRKFTQELKNRDYYKVYGYQLNTKIVGNYRIKDFLAKDDYYKTYLKNPFPEFEMYWLIDKDVLYMMLELITQLKEEGYNPDGFHIRNSHRHPKLNTDGKGASYSQHMFGKAIDIGVDDIDQDGDSTQADKMIVYEMLQKIVGNKGGLGLYPGTTSLHFDCRGFRARWDWP